MLYTVEAVDREEQRDEGRARTTRCLFSQSVGRSVRQGYTATSPLTTTVQSLVDLPGHALGVTLTLVAEEVALQVVSLSELDGAEVALVEVGVGCAMVREGEGRGSSSEGEERVGEHFDARRGLCWVSVKGAEREP